VGCFLPPGVGWMVIFVVGWNECGLDGLVCGFMRWGSGYFIYERLVGGYVSDLVLVLD